MTDQRPAHGRIPAGPRQAMPRTKTESDRPTVRQLRDQADKVRTEAALDSDPLTRARMLKRANLRQRRRHVRRPFSSEETEGT
jgi:hypothetical protein